jgi:hypothetical protein
MAESIREAKQHLHEAREAQREHAAAFWQRAIDEGRVLRQSATRMHRETRDDKTVERTPSLAP